MQSLRDIGFKTFAPIIDETYDTIENDEQRMHAILAEITRLSQKTEDEWIEFLAAVKPIVSHNQQRYKEIFTHNVNVITEKEVLSESSLYHTF